MKGSLPSATRTQRRADSDPGFDADPVIHRGPNALLAAEVSLRRLDRDVPEEELDLLQLAARRMAQPSACSPKIVRREPLDARFAGVLADHVPDCLSVKLSPQAFPFSLTRRK